MEVQELSIKGVYKFSPRVFNDNRGHFIESFNEQVMSKWLGDIRFVQDNHSFSHKGVLRGVHFQKGEHAQGKLVRVASGKVIDVIVDIDKNSPTFGQYEKVVLDSEKYEMVYLPDTMAHGFLALEDTIFQYKCTNFYNVGAEGGIIWDDPDLNIDWEISTPNLSDKDLSLPRLEEIEKHL